MASAGCGRTPPAAAEEELLLLPLKGGQRSGEDLLQFLRPGGLEQVSQGSHLIAVKHIVTVPCDKYQLEALVCLPQGPGRIHAVGPLHLDVQEHQIQLPACRSIQPSSASPEENSSSRAGADRPSSARSSSTRSWKRDSRASSQIPI